MSGQRRRWWGSPPPENNNPITDDSVRNQITGDHAGTVVQARDIHGDVTVMHDSSAPLLDAPITVSTQILSTNSVTIEPLVPDGPDGERLPVSGGQQIEVLLETRIRQAVVLHGMQVVVIARTPPRPSVDVDGLTGLMPVRGFAVDLDPDPPRITAHSADFPFKISDSNPEVFVFEPTITANEVEWALELDWTCARRRSTTRVPERWNFQLYPMYSSRRSHPGRR
ncbi:hypothetical protein [Nocardia tengchongensis]|uniref:hypothetical protein n=1 Tax=Nocardia tengchongensis TaxID=2055889 RepID=UPI0036100BC0